MQPLRPTSFRHNKGTSHPSPSFIIRRRLSFPPLPFHFPRKKASSICIVTILPHDIANSVSMAAQLITRTLLAAVYFLGNGVAMARCLLCQPTYLAVGCEVALTAWGVGGVLSGLLAAHLGLLGLVAMYWPVQPVQPPAGSR